MPRTQGGRTGRHAAPASDGLADSARVTDKRERARRNYPSKTGPKSLETTENIITAALAILDENAERGPLAQAASEAAVSLGIDASGRPIKVVIKAAREALARRAADYANLHWQASVMAAMKGDAGPAQWAIERIAEGGQRIIDAPKSGPAAPTLQIGIALGGMPTAPNQPRITSADMPPIDALPAEQDVP